MTAATTSEQRMLRKQPHHRGHQHRTEHEVVVDGVQGSPDKSRAIVKRLDAHALRQPTGVELRHFLLDALQHLRRVLAPPHST